MIAFYFANSKPRQIQTYRRVPRPPIDTASHLPALDMRRRVSMRRQLLTHSELFLFLTAWVVGLMGAWADYRATERPDRDDRAAVSIDAPQRVLD